MPRLLLVEDAPDVALVVQRLAAGAGVEVTHTADVPSAWAALARQRPDLILLDLNLPGERGEVLCRRVKAAPDLAGVPVALFTHWDRPEDVLSGLEAGADHLVTKELLGRPGAWQSRLREILPPGDGLVRGLSVDCERYDLLPQPPPEGVRALDLALRHPLMRQLGAGVLRLLVSRAVRRAAGSPGGDRVGQALRPDGPGLDVRGAAAVGTAALAAFAAALTEELYRLLGGEAAAPALDALTAALARLGAEAHQR